LIGPSVLAYWVIKNTNVSVRGHSILKLSHRDSSRKYRDQRLRKICYKTKTNDEGLDSVDILSVEKIQFLQDYRRLFQLPELFKTKEAFSGMRNKQARKGAQKKNGSQGFEIENVTICCRDVSLLQAPIPYARRLLQLFPRIKQNTKCVLSPHEIRNNAHQIESKHYPETFQQSPLDCKFDALSLGDFINCND
jgi:hypothetical protein